VALLLPLGFFLLLIPWVRRFQGRGSLAAGGWEGSLLLAAAFWGAFHALTLEALSALRAIRPTPVLVMWLAADLALGVPLVWQISRLRLRWPRLATPEWVFVLLVSLVLAALLLVAWVAPPNNSDSLLYHMARVVHWAQNASLRHYGTAYGHQLWNPPFAETVILTLRSLWGDDRPANLVQWSALVGVLVGVSGMARLLGLGRGGRLLAVAFAVSLPMALLQATSTQNDLVTGFWLVAAAFLVMLDRQGTLGRVERLALGAALGLGLLTKGTFYVYGGVIGGWFVITRPWRGQAGRAALQVVAIGAVVLLLNAGHWSRNLAVGGTPLGPPEWLGGHGTLSLASLKPRVAAYPPRLLRSLAPHLAGPWPEYNAAIEAGVREAYRVFGVEVNAPIVVWAWNHEDYAGNPLHLLLVAGTTLGLALSPQARRTGVLGLAAAAATAYLLMVLMLPPAITTVGVRLHLPLFLLWAPAFAAVVSAWLPRRAAALVAIGLVLLALPWLLFNATRPLIGMRPEPAGPEVPCLGPLGCTRVGSVLTQPQADLVFAQLRDAQAGYTAAAAAVRESSCRRIGLRIDSSDPEYALWWLLDAPQSGFRLETIYTTPELEPLIDRSFRPCAIVCTICGGRTQLHGLELGFASGSVRLFLGDGFTWDEDG